MKFRVIGYGDFNAAANRLRDIQSSIRSDGESWARQKAQKMHDQAIENLSEQGRGGLAPPLSGATLQIYQQDGEPDGSAVRNHIEILFESTARKFSATVGIPKGEPTRIAKIQNNGALIPVTDKMRGFLSSRGIYLRAETTHIQIPARYFWEEAFKEACRD